MIWYKNGTVEATGSAVNVVLGFIPGRVRVFNLKTGKDIIWTNDMAAASGVIGGSKKYNATGLHKSPRAAIGSTPANVANSAFDFEIAGVLYTKAAVAAGTAPTATTVPQNKWGLFGYEIGADGTIDKKDAADNATGYASEALAIAALPSASASHLLFMYVTVKSTDGGGFVGATTSLADAAVTANYYNTALANYVSSGGISTYASSGYGFTIGTNTDINVSGDTLYYEAWRV